MRHPTRHPALAALLVAVFALVTACGQGGGVSSLPKAPPPSASPTPTDPAVAVGGLSQDDIAVTDATPPTPGDDLAFASPIYTVETATPLTAPTTVRLQLDNALPRTSPIFVVTRTQPTNPWTYLPGRLTSDQRHVEFTATHFSDVAVLVMDLEGALQNFRDDVRERLDFGVNTKVKKPQCLASDEGRKDGYSVGYSRGKKTVFWCFGFENDKRVLKVVNRRVLPIQVAHADAPELPPAFTTPKMWTAWGPVLGDTATVLPPGRTITYDVDLEPTKRVLISAATDSKAQALRALQAVTGALVTRVIGFDAGKSNTVNTVAGLLKRPQCAKTVGLGSDKMLAGCFSRRKVMATFGSRGRLLARLTGATSTAAFLRKQFKAIALDVQKEGEQNIVVRRAKPDFTDFVGAYTGEARMMTVNAEGLVFESANNVTDKGTERVADVTYQLSEPRSENGVARAQAVVTAVKIYNRKAFHDRIPRVGDTGIFRIEGGVVRSPFVKRQYCEGKAARKGVCG